MQDAFGGDVYKMKVVILGLAFKPDSDDVRTSPALDVAVRVHGLGTEVVVTDPEAIANSRRLHPQLTFAESTSKALTGADAVVLVAQWSEFRQLDPSAVAELTAGHIVIDGRNCLDAVAWRSAGWPHRGLGRP